MSLVLAWVLCMGVGPTKLVFAQSSPVLVRDHIFLPPTCGATVLSTYIDAQARYIAAMGDFLESAAIARRHHAAAAEQEMRNSVLWVETYFTRRELNRAYRLKSRPPLIEKKAIRDKAIHRRIAELPGWVREGDVTDELNWLLNKLATTALAYKFFYGSDETYEGSSMDQRLSPHDIGHIVFTDGGHKDGHQLTFRADDPKVLHPRWPLFLRAPEFARGREQFEKMRDLALSELEKDGEIRYETWTQLRQAVDMLAEKLNEKHRKQRGDPSSGPMSPELFLMYLQGKRCLQSLALAIHRAMTTDDMEVFRGSYKFTGDSVMKLIQHACRHGLQFSPPEPGDEPTYEKLLIAMRHIYLQFHPELGS